MFENSHFLRSVGEVPDRHYSFSFVEKQVGKDKGSSDEQSQSATAIDKSDSMDSAQPLPEDVKNIQPSCLNEHGLIGDSSPRLSECSTDVTFDGPDDSDSDINGDDDCSIDVRWSLYCLLVLFFWLLLTELILLLFL